MINNFVQKLENLVVSLFFYEVKIKKGLLFDPRSLELVGFTNLGDDDN